MVIDSSGSGTALSPARVTDQMRDRDLVMGNVRHVLRNGFVLEEGEPATRPGLSRYGIEGVSPNSGGRTVRVVFIPNLAGCSAKILTVMWADDNRFRG